MGLQTVDVRDMRTHAFTCMNSCFATALTEDVPKDVLSSLGQKTGARVHVSPRVLSLGKNAFPNNMGVTTFKVSHM